MSMHLKHLSFLILVLHYKNFTISLASNPARFFEFESAPSPIEPPLPPETAPAPPLQPPLQPPHPPQSPPQGLPAAPPLPLPPIQSSPLTAASGGMNGGQKAGIVVGSLAGAALLVAAGAGIVYKKRRSDATIMQLEMAAMQPVFRVDSHNATPYTHLDDHAP